MKNKYVIYTVLVGGYDDVLQPAVIDERFDYILFSNDFDTDKIGVWNIRKIPIVVENDNKRLSRYPKTHPGTLLSEYEASLYIDANIQISDKWVYDRFIELFNNKIEFAGVKLHVTDRDCIYEHTFDMSHWNAENDTNSIIQCHELYKRGFPRHFGLNENNILYRAHTERIKQVDEEWWWWITNYSFRDQFSYMFCLWKYGIPLTRFMSDEINSRQCMYFRFSTHNKNKRLFKQKWVRKNIFEKLRNYYSRNFESRALNKWHSYYQSNHPVFSLHFFGTLEALIHIPLIPVKRFF